jgi:uncharacterized protein (TIGR02246 family)
VRFVLSLLVVLSSVSLCDSADQEILAVLDAQTVAWNKGDVETFMKGYQDSPDLTFVGKAVTKGYQPVLERYRKSYPTSAAMGTLSFSDQVVRLLDKNNAIITGRFHLKRTTEGGGDATGIYSLVMRRTKQGWKIVHDHTSSLP